MYLEIWVAEHTLEIELFVVSRGAHCPAHPRDMFGLREWG